MKMLIIFSLVSLIFLQISATVIQPPPQFYRPVFLEHPHVINKRETDQPIRIAPIYDTDSTSFLTKEQREYVEDIIMSNITNFFSSLLSVKPLRVPIRSARGCNGRATTVQFNNFESFAPGCFGTCSATTTCGAAVIPEDHLFQCIECDSTLSCEFSTTSTEGAGVADTDLVIYVTATNADCTNTFAYAIPCSQEFALNRPVVATVNFCPLSFTSDVTDEFLITIIKHELIHALGFSSFLYAFFRDENGNPRTPRTNLFGSVPIDSNGFPIASNSTIKLVNYDWETANGRLSKPVVLLVTPRVVKEARDHFGCDTLEGAELESQGGGGSAGSHWDLRVFGNEVMISVIFTGDMPLSRITLALLEDSGWYSPNYDMAEDFLGNNLGCDFVNQSCLGYYNRDDVKEENVFCFQENEQGCSSTRDSIGNCWIIEYPSQLANLYQYFSNPNKGGPFEFSEFCPFYRGSHDCTNSNIQPLSAVFSNGPNSRCFNHMGDVTVSDGTSTTVQPLNAGCYQYSCNTTGVYVTVGSTEYECRNRGDVVMVEERVGGDTYTFTLVCPSCESICWDRLELCGNRTRAQVAENATMATQTTMNTPTQTTMNIPTQTTMNIPTLQTITQTIVSTTEEATTRNTTLDNSGTVKKFSNVIITLLLMLVLYIVY